MVSKVLSIKHRHECNFCYHAFHACALFLTVWYYKPYLFYETLKFNKNH